jgi:hypothetical protein
MCANINTAVPARVLPALALMLLSRVWIYAWRNKHIDMAGHLAASSGCLFDNFKIVIWRTNTCYE